MYDYQHSSQPRPSSYYSPGKHGIVAGSKIDSLAKAISPKVLQKPNVLSYMTAAGIDLATAPTCGDSQEDQDKMLKKLSQAIIEMRCTDRLLSSFALSVGILAILMQTLALFTDEWLITQEPRPINRSDEQGLQTEINFMFNSGYFRLCRERKIMDGENFTNPEDFHYFYKSTDAKTQFNRNCHANPYFSDQDLSNISRATSAILVRIQYTAFIHMVSVVLNVLGTVFGVIGHRRSNNKTIYAAIIFIIAGMCICMAVLQYICVVDDEMSPRMKTTAEADETAPKYDYYYGYSFLAAAVSFLVIQMAALSHLFLFFRRFRSIEEKCRLVPGLSEKVLKVRMEKELGAPSPSPLQVKRGSLAGVHSPPRSPRTNGENGHQHYFLIEAL